MSVTVAPAVPSVAASAVDSLIDLKTSIKWMDMAIVYRAWAGIVHACHASGEVRGDRSGWAAFTRAIGIDKSRYGHVREVVHSLCESGFSSIKEVDGVIVLSAGTLLRPTDSPADRAVPVVLAPPVTAGSAGYKMAACVWLMRLLRHHASLPCCHVCTDELALRFGFPRSSADKLIDLWIRSGILSRAHGGIVARRGTPIGEALAALGEADREREITYNDHV